MDPVVSVLPTAVSKVKDEHSISIIHSLKTWIVDIITKFC